MKDLISSSLKSSSELMITVEKTLSGRIEEAAKTIISAMKAGNKVLFFGNGGSAADSQHLAAEFVGRFKKNRVALPAIALSVDTSILTALGNDFGFETVFARQVEALAKKGDIAIGLTTSGNSPNVLEALKAAKKIGCKTIGFSGCGGGKTEKMVDIPLTIPSDDTPRIQEAQIAVGHIICHLVERALFE
jgi:D-sedoheptulose 7-phosphate isomerase